ncbi:MAG TPA: hypothetical protein VHF89_15815 [Solirubrobacteraceae bacterium]|nr:hypothetical protein [Solirubrobacteraceae bacterium]
MKRILIMTVAATALAAAIATGATPPFGEHADVLPSMRPTEVLRPEGVPASLGERFGVFRAAAGETDALSPTAKSALQRMARDHQGANLDLSRRIATSARWSAWVVPANDALCWTLVEERRGASAGCTPIVQAAAGEAYMLSYGGFGLRDGRVLVSGLMPDGVRSVTVTDRSGTSVSAPVERNAYVVESGEPARLSWTVDGAERSLELGER